MDATLVDDLYCCQKNILVLPDETSKHWYAQYYKDGEQFDPRSLKKVEIELLKLD